MSKLHPKRRTYASLDQWLKQDGGTIPAGHDQVNWLQDVLMWDDDIDGIDRDDLRRCVESWLRVNVVPETPPQEPVTPPKAEDCGWEF